MTDFVTVTDIAPVRTLHGDHPIVVVFDGFEKTTGKYVQFFLQSAPAAHLDNRLREYGTAHVISVPEQNLISVGREIFA